MILTSRLVPDNGHRLSKSCHIANKPSLLRSKSETRTVSIRQHRMSTSCLFGYKDTKGLNLKPYSISFPILGKQAQLFFVYGFKNKLNNAPKSDQTCDQTTIPFFVEGGKGIRLKVWFGNF
ncbi:hypothetical protein SCA6_005059 [Theobroma cacao]